MNRPFKKYIGVGKFLAKRGLKWMPTNANTYPDATTVVRTELSAGYALNDFVGRVLATWYIKFKGLNL